MLVGKFEGRLDSKNRVTVPQRLRETRADGGMVCLWSQFYLTLGAEGCIFVYTPQVWQRLMEEIGATKPLADDCMRTVQRLVAAHADLRECDGQGRIVLSDELRAHANITREIIFLGACSRAEIWDKDRWIAYSRQNISQLGEKMDMVSRAGLALPERVDPGRKGPQA